MLNEAFRLANEPDFEYPLKLIPSWDPRNKWLYFSGAEAICLAQFCYQNPDLAPILTFECSRINSDGEKIGPHRYEYLIVNSLAHSADKTSINGTIDNGRYQLHVVPGVSESTEGNVITYVQTSREFFPMKEYLAFRQEKLEQQQAEFGAPAVS